jgi:hypothetical protein
MSPTRKGRLFADGAYTEVTHPTMQVTPMDQVSPADCLCEELDVRGPEGDREVYCPRCGKVFRESSDSATEPRTEKP